MSEIFLVDDSQKKGGMSASPKNAIGAVPTDVAGFVGDGGGAGRLLDVLHHVGHALLLQVVGRLVARPAP